MQIHALGAHPERAGGIEGSTRIPAARAGNRRHPSPPRRRLTARQWSFAPIPLRCHRRRQVGGVWQGQIPPTSRPPAWYRNPSLASPPHAFSAGASGIAPLVLPMREGALLASPPPRKPSWWTPSAASPVEPADATRLHHVDRRHPRAQVVLPQHGLLLSVLVLVVPLLRDGVLPRARAEWPGSLVASPA